MPDQPNTYADFLRRLTELIREAEQDEYLDQGVTHLYEARGAFKGQFKRRYPDWVL